MFRRYPRAKAKSTKKTPGAMNKTEARFDGYLRALLHAGRIADYRFEAMKFRLADNTYYIPDFMVVTLDGYFRMIDVKGRTKSKHTGKESYWCEEDAKIKIKVIADQLPWFSFAVAWESKEAGWTIECFGEDEAFTL